MICHNYLRIYLEVSLFALEMITSESLFIRKIVLSNFRAGNRLRFFLVVDIYKFVGRLNQGPSFAVQFAILLENVNAISPEVFQFFRIKMDHTRS